MDVQVEPGSGPALRLDLDVARYAPLDRASNRVGQVGPRRDELPVGLPDHGVAAHLQPALGLRVHVDDAIVPVERDVAVVDGREDIVQAGDARRQLRVRPLGLVDVGDDADDPGDGAAVGAGQHRVSASQPAVLAIGSLDAQLLAQDLAFGRSLDSREVPAKAGQVRRVDEPLEVREPQPMRARCGEAQNLPHPMPQEGDAAPEDVVDVDDVGGGAHDAPQHVLRALFAVPCGAVDHHGAHAPAVNN